MSKIALVFLFIATLARSQTIKGTVIDELRNVTFISAEVHLLDSLMKETNLAMTDENGTFSFDKVTNGTHHLKVFYSDGDTTFKNIKIRGDTLLELDVHKPCKYDNSIRDKTCPACHKQDKTIPIIYGLLVSSKGNPMKHEGKKFIAGSCQMVSSCNPNWYCKRDKTRF